MSYTYQKFVGSIVPGINDWLYWWEDNGGGGTSLQVQVTGGTWYPSQIASNIASQMTAISLGLGDSITYTCTLNENTGQATIQASAGTFYLKLTAAEAFKFLTGGDAAVGSHGSQWFGWDVDSGYPSASASQVSDGAAGCGWYPDQPKATDDLGQSVSTSVEAVSMGGSVVAYDFSGDGEYLKTRSLSYEQMSQATRDQWEEEFWPFAKGGKTFRYYDNRASASYVDYCLTGDVLSSPQFTRNTPSLARWDLPLTMRRVKS